jgi:hypothetical protein
MRGTPAPLRRSPGRRRHVKPQQLPDGPAMRRDARGHRRRRHPSVAETGVRRAQVSERAPQAPPLVPRQGLAGPRPATARQRGEAVPARRGEPLTVGRGHDPGPLRAAPQCRHAGRRPLAHAAVGLAAPPPLVALDPWGAQDRGPRTSAGPPAWPRGHGRATGLPESPAGGPHALGAPQPRTSCRAAPHPRAQPADQGPVTRRAALAAPPHARLDPQGQRQPHEAALVLAAEGIGRHWPQIAWGLDQRRGHRWALMARAGPPSGNRALVDATSGHHGWHGPPMGAPGHHEDHGSPMARRTHVIISEQVTVALPFQKTALRVLEGFGSCR